MLGDGAAMRRLLSCCIPKSPASNGATCRLIFSPDLSDDPGESSAYDYDGPIPDEVIERTIIASEVRAALDPTNPLWLDRVERDGATPTPDNLTIGWQIDKYLDLERDRVLSNALSPAEFDLVRYCLLNFREWVGKETTVDKIDPDRWESYWGYLLRWSGSVEYKKKRFRHARNFIAWLASKGVMPMPLNLLSRKYKFTGSANAPTAMSIEEVRRLIENATGQLRLHLLLMANCGMTQIDISDLRPDEIEWTDGRIIRKRSKTRDKANVPTVNFGLWPETWELLRVFGRTEGDRALLTKSGGPWVRDYLDANGKRKKVDSIKSNFVHLAKNLGYAQPPLLKRIRKTSSTQFDRHEKYGRWAGHFLGHAGQTIGEQHYYDRRGRLPIFDEAVEWLGRKVYGFVSLTGVPRGLPSRRVRPHPRGLAPDVPRTAPQQADRPAR